MNLFKANLLTFTVTIHSKLEEAIFIIQSNVSHWIYRMERRYRLKSVSTIWSRSLSIQQNYIFYWFGCTFYLVLLKRHLTVVFHSVILSIRILFICTLLMRFFSYSFYSYNFDSYTFFPFVHFSFAYFFSLVYFWFICVSYTYFHVRIIHTISNSGVVPRLPETFSKVKIQINPLQPSVAFLYPLKTSEVFWYF